MPDKLSESSSLNAHDQPPRKRGARVGSTSAHTLDVPGLNIVDWEQAFNAEATESARRYWDSLPDPKREQPRTDEDRFRFDLGRLFKRVWSELCPSR